MFKLDLLKKKKELPAILLIILISSIFSLPLLSPGFIQGHDSFILLGSFTIGEFTCAKVNGVDIEKAEETCKNNVLLRFSSKKEAADIALKAFFSAISDYHSRQQKKDSFEDIVDALGKYEEGTPPRNLRHEFEL